jgi:hypothetical protein
MAKQTYGHTVGRDGRPRVQNQSLPRHLRGYDPEFDVVTFTEGPLRRLLGRKR